jgi:hypothetical protein
MEEAGEHHTDGFKRNAERTNSLKKVVLPLPE